MAYLRYEAAASFGVIVSGESNIAFHNSGQHLLAPALEKICIWHVRQGVCNKTLAPSNSKGPSLAVTAIVSSPFSSSQIASGYANGSIIIWDSEKGICETTLKQHTGTVTVLRYNKLGSLLASGSKDNDVILWDVMGEIDLFHLQGHRDQVTDLVFLDSDKKLVTASKDKFLRVWNLDTKHCMQIISGHHTEIWSIDIDPEERYLVTGSADPELRFYTIKHDLADGQLIANKSETDVKKDLPTENESVLKSVGEIQRQSEDRVATVRFNKSGKLLACQVAGKTVEIFRVLDESESKRKAKRRISRKEKKAAKEGLKAAGKGERDIGAEGGSNPVVTAPDIFKLHQTLRTRKKICSISFSPVTSKNSLATLALSLNNNRLEFHAIESSSITKRSAIELQGHRADVRSVTLSSDNTLLMSTSHRAIKIWNLTTDTCFRTIDSEYGLCGLFVPDNKYAVVGTKGGTLEFIDVRSSTCVEVVEAHGGSVQSIALTPDGQGFVTGSADHYVRFWKFQMVQKADQSYKHLTASPAGNLNINVDVQVVVASPDGTFIAVASLDSTVKVFYLHSLELYHEIDHNLSVLCMDISSDDVLLVSGSTDKNVNIWGLDAKHVHKGTLVAHADSVTGVKFVPNTHYFFTVGKDCLVKYWDADKLELLLTLEGHHAEVCCLSMSNQGDFIVTGSRDRSIRRWNRTDEQFSIEDEKQTRVEERVVALVGKRTREATDTIIEALNMADAELKRIAEHDKEVKSKRRASEFRPNILMHGLSPSDFVLHTFSSIHATDLEQSLLGLPFSDALNILSYLENWASIPDKVELACTVATVLVRNHHDKLTSTVSAKPLLIRLKDILHPSIKELKDMIGGNLAMMYHLQDMLASRSESRDAKARVLERRNKEHIEAREDKKQEK